MTHSQLALDLSKRIASIWYEDEMGGFHPLIDREEAQRAIATLLQRAINETKKADRLIALQVAGEKAKRMEEEGQLNFAANANATGEAIADAILPSSEPFHPKHCGPCLWCRDTARQKTNSGCSSSSASSNGGGVSVVPAFFHEEVHAGEVR